MNILHVVTDLNPRLGGSVEAARQMAGSMSHCGVEVETLTLVPFEPSASRWPSVVHQMGATRTSYRYTRRLVPWLQRFHSRYDAVIVHGVWRYASLGVWSALRKTATPYFLFTHGMLDPWFQWNYRLKHIKKSLFWRAAEHKVLRDARAVLFTSEEERRLAKISFRPYSCRESVVGLGTEGPPGESFVALRTFFDRFPRLRGKRIVLHLGRLHAKKGCDLLIRAFARLAPSDSRFHLVMAGPDEGWLADLQRLALRCGVSDRVTWTGHLDGHAKWGAMRSAEVFALISHTENYGISIAEAMACGLPVLISNKVNTWREIEADGAGMVANDDLTGATELLSKWSALDAAQKGEFSHRAVACFERRFEIRGFTTRMIEYIRQETTSRRGAITDAACLR